MTRLMRFVGASIVVTLVWPAALWAQYDSELVGFNGPPIDDPATSQEMFRTPQFSGTTSGFIVPNVDPYDNNAAFRASGLQTEGLAALETFFLWVDPADPYGWVRLTTFDGPERPNPSLDTRGKVRFKITNRSELSAGEIGLCIGIRETGGVGIPQMGDGGTSGPIEWVGVTGVVTDPNDPNLVIAPIPAITLVPSAQPYSLEWDLATGVVSVNGTPQGGEIAGFTGNGILDAPDNRGTFEHIAITNVVADTAILINFAIDELQFEATEPDPTPPPVIRGPVVETDTEVEVECIVDAIVAELFLNDASQGYAIPSGGVATFSGLTLNVDDVLTATQTANGITSDPSAPVVVYPEGTALAENFDGYTSQEDLEALWMQDDPSDEYKFHLTSGSASSCQNFVFSDYDDAPYDGVSRLYYSIGSVNGTDAEPLLVTYRFKHDTNNSNARGRFELASSLSRVHGALGFAFTNGVGGAWGLQYTSMTNSPAPIIEGYVSDYFGYDYAPTGIERVSGVWHKMQIEVLTDVVNFYIDDVLANPIDPETELPIWPGGVPRVNNTDFQYIILGTMNSNNGSAMMYDDISVTIGDTSLPFGDPNPVESPTIDGPLFPGDTIVDVYDIDPDNATDVAVYADGVEVGGVSGSFPTGTATVTVPSLSNGETVTATQTVDAIESCFSWPVVVAVPAPTLESILVPGQTLVSVSNIEENLAAAVMVYKDLGEGELQLLGTLANPTEDPTVITTTPLVDGDTIVATQTIDGVESPLSTSVIVAVPAPTIPGPLDLGDTIVTITDVHPLAEIVTVYLNSTPYSIDPAGETAVDVTVPPLQRGMAVRATQTIDGLEGPYSNTLLVGNDVFINEFNYDDAAAYYQEPDNLAFIELYNGGEDPIDISDWVIQVGDYIEGQDPPGVYYQVFIPTDTTIDAYGYWTVGMTDVTAIEGAVVDLIDDSLRMDDGMNYLALRNLNGILLDAVGWELNKGPTYGYTFIPEEIYTQIGTGIWGNHVNADDPPTSQSRFLDGLDTDENGRDFGIQPATPGYTNNQPDLMPYFEDAESFYPLDPLPDWVFSYKPLVVVDPTVVDSGGTGGLSINPSAIPVSPDGGLALIGWDEEGGGNADYMGQLAQENFTLETYIYIAPEYTPSGYEETKIGIRGSADGVHNFDFYNGATGLCWFLQRGSTWQTLYLLDENNGDDGEYGEPICATVLGTINIGIDSEFTGWQRLLLETYGDTVLGIFGGTYGSRDDGFQLSAFHDSPGPGGVYISYREAVSDNITARPATLDAFSLAEPARIPGDVDGDGDVDLSDLAALLGSYGVCEGEPGYNLFADFDRSGCVELSDLAELLGHYGDGT